jgi:hypothetical protein
VNPIADFLVKNCFWDLVDTGRTGEETPLLTGLFEGGLLAEILCHRFGISLEEAEFEIKAARSEIKL